MSNHLVISVYKLIDDTDSPCYGFTASDNYGSYFETFETFKEFINAYPTETRLVQAVLSSTPFESGGVYTDDGEFISDTITGFACNYVAAVHKFQEELARLLDS